MTKVLFSKSSGKENDECLIDVVAIEPPKGCCFYKWKITSTLLGILNIMVDTPILMFIFVMCPTCVFIQYNTEHLDRSNVKGLPYLYFFQYFVKQVLAIIFNILLVIGISIDKRSLVNAWVIGTSAQLAYNVVRFLIFLFNYELFHTTTMFELIEFVVNGVQLLIVWQHFRTMKSVVQPVPIEEKNKVDF